MSMPPVLLVLYYSQADQEVPDFLSAAAQGGSLGATYKGSGQFASTDIRCQVSHVWGNTFLVKCKIVKIFFAYN